METKNTFGLIRRHMKEFTRFIAQEQNGIANALENVTKKLPSSVREIASYAFLSGGKRLRPVLTLLWYNLLETEQK